MWLYVAITIDNCTIETLEVLDTCDIMVASLWYHVQYHALGCVTKKLTLWSGGHEVLNSEEQRGDCVAMATNKAGLF